MGDYLNAECEIFREGIQSEIYVDKSELIAVTNRYIKTQQKYICISRPRRFGKSMALSMLSAYYGCDGDTAHLFEDLKICKDATYHTHLNQYNCIQLNIQEFLSDTDTVEEMIAEITRFLLDDFKKAYPEVHFRKETSLVWIMKDVYLNTERPFIILIDEWDCLFREYENDVDAQKKYLDFLRMWLKDQAYVGLAYMTGILPIKKYGSHSALNMFYEYSMIDPGRFAPFFGFTQEEVRVLCEQYHMSVEETAAWYNGYEMEYKMSSGFVTPLQKIAIYSPKSLVESLKRGKYGTYWNQTETYEALRTYIQMNLDGLKDAVIVMLSGGSIAIRTGTFINDMTTFVNRDDVLTLLVHLGYLSYNESDGTVSIPNREVGMEYENVVRVLPWKEVANSLHNSQKLLEGIWNMDSEQVAAGVEQVHQEVSILQYNDENALSYTVGLAFYVAREYYTIIRELPSGKGFADVCMIPRKLYVDKPALLIELKWNKTANGAIEQIKKKNYPVALQEYQGNLLLVGINYDKDRKKHSCTIENCTFG
ncbi:MAG: ATP-binding protein [Lachnospiraceae bacterium]|nr:ATP-binding protein [Lachnospiraceae bacterium]